MTWRKSYIIYDLILSSIFSDSSKNSSTLGRISLPFFVSWYLILLLSLTVIIVGSITPYFAKSLILLPIVSGLVFSSFKSSLKDFGFCFNARMTSAKYFLSMISIGMYRKLSGNGLSNKTTELVKTTKNEVLIRYEGSFNKRRKTCGLSL